MNPTSPNLVEQFALHSGLPAELLADGAMQVRSRQLAAGEVLFREGEIQRDLYVVVEGLLGLEMFVSGRGRTRILSLGVGNLVAWSALLGDSRMTTSATAIQDSQLLSVPALLLLERCERNPLLGYRLMRRVAQSLADRLVATRLQLLDLFPEPSSATRGS